MYKTIVVHVDDHPQLPTRLAVAADLAARHGGHLVGSAATGFSHRDYLMLSASGMGGLPEGDFDRLRERAGRHAAAFAARMEQFGVESWEQRIVEDDAEHALLLQSRYADLIVLSPGTPARARLRLTTDLPEYVALHCTRPVLVVPDDYPSDTVGTTAVIGWNASMEATRAIAGALPLLTSAAAVLIALINPYTLGGNHGEQPGADLATYLARHGVNVEVVHERSDAGTAPALLGIARDAGADLLVAGAYGHSRYREWIAGGVTRALLANIAVPLMMAH